ncbi:MAG: hypothetical protein WC246_00195 [Candidatus Paceibacterota bacterium]|jgi:hypothetical protein
MIRISREQINERWENISQVLRDAIFSIVNDHHLDRIAEKNQITPDNRYDLEKIVDLVFLGFLPYRDAMRELQEVLAVNEKTALAVYQEIDANLFEPIRKDIEDNYLKFKVGVIDAASVQKPDVVSQINLKTPEPEGTVNLKKEEAGPRILAMKESGGTGAFVPPRASRPLQQKETSPSSEPSIIQKKQDVEGASRRPVPPSPDSEKDIFSLSTKDLWGIENENIAASRRIMGQPAAAPSDDSALLNARHPSSPASVKPSGALDPKIKKPEHDLLPVIEDSRLPEVMPVPHPIAGKPIHPNEKKEILPLPSAPVIHPQETKISQKTIETTPPTSPASVNVSIAPQNNAPQPLPTQTSAFGGNINTQPVLNQPTGRVAEPEQAPPQVRPIQWAPPAQAPRQPDVVVEVRQTREEGGSSSGNPYQAGQPAHEAMPSRPMKMAPLASSTPAPKDADAPMVSGMGLPRQQEVNKKPIDPNEVVDMGPVIIHKRDDPSVAQARSGSQYQNLSYSGFSKNLSSQPSHQSAAPAVADVQVPPPSQGAAQTVGISVDKHDQYPAVGYGQTPVVSAPQKKRGFFSFFRKS